MAIVVDWFVPGGMINVVLNQIKILNEIKSEILVCGPPTPVQGEVVIGSRARVAEVPIPLAVRNLGKVVRSSRVLKNTMKRFCPDLIIAHNLRSSLVSALSSPEVPCAFINHGQPPKGLASAVVTSYLGNYPNLAISNYPIEGSKWLYVPFVSPLCVETKIASAAKSATGNRIGWFGRLSPPKRPDVWIEILASVTQKIGEDVVGVVVGDGPLMVETQNLASSKSLDVKFTGHLDPISTFQHMDISVFWSDSEGMPLALQEAVWSGVPVVTNRLPGIEAFFGTDMPGLVDTPQEAVEEILKLQDPSYFKEVLGKQQARIIELKKRPSLNDLLINFIQARQVDVSL